MDKFKLSLAIIFFGLFFASPVLAFGEANNSSLSAGKILSDSKNLGAFWYVYPGDFHRYFVGTPEEAYAVVKNLSLGISNADFTKISSSTPDRLKGLFVIKVEDAGRTFYVDPIGKTLVYVQNPQSALFVLRHFSIATSSDYLKDIPVAKIITDKEGREISRQWQYLGFWGSVNYKYVPAMKEPKLKAKKLGAYSKINRLKILAAKKSEGTLWYQVDGGLHPGAWIEAKFITALPQPVPEKIIATPKTVKTGDYWIDVNISRSVLTLFKGLEPVMATYVSTGVKESPTIIGLYNIRYKFKKTRMHGGPPAATHYYDLKDVPWTMYYEGSYSVHGAYWHDEFGGLRSAGCTNTTISDAKFIFDLVGPVGDAEKVRFSKTNPGSVVYNHY